MKSQHRTLMHAVLRDGEPYMVLPTLDKAETYLGIFSLNGFSKHNWTIKRVVVAFPYETATERRKRLDRHVQAVVELNRAISHS